MGNFDHNAVIRGFQLTVVASESPLSAIDPDHSGSPMAARYGRSLRNRGSRKSGDLRGRGLRCD